MSCKHFQVSHSVTVMTVMIFFSRICNGHELFHLTDQQDPKNKV